MRSARLVARYYLVPTTYDIYMLLLSSHVSLDRFLNFFFLFSFRFEALFHLFLLFDVLEFYTESWSCLGHIQNTEIDKCTAR